MKIIPDKVLDSLRNTNAQLTLIGVAVFAICGGIIVVAFWAFRKWTGH